MTQDAIYNSAGAPQLVSFLATRLRAPADNQMAMTHVRATLSLLFALLAFPGGAAAQAPRPQKVYLSGENPYLALRDVPDGPLTARASFWRIHWSPVGPGHVCFVTVGEQGKPGAVRVALHDNARLLDHLTNAVLGSFDRAYLDWPFTPIAAATFRQSGDAKTEYRETCQAPGYAIELAWHDLLEPGLMDILPGSRATNPFGITYLRIPAGRAVMTINGAPAPGRSTPAGSFLAFGETWIK